MFYNYRPDGLSEKGMSKHTPEPWVLFEVGGGIKHLCPAAGKSKTSILTVATEDGVEFGAVYRDDDARRIVACVNACAGFTTEELEAHTGPRLLHTRLQEAFTRIDALLGERNATGLAIDAAIRSGIVPERHPLRSRLDMLANHRQREQELLAALEEARTGLAWYQETYPETANGSDDEAMARIDAAIAGTKAE